MAPAPARPAALGDVTVLDLSLQLPGPFATMLLRGMGARVVKLEPPGGDPARAIDPAMFAAVNAGKESIELDLKSDAGRDVADRLAARADVVVEGFRPGVAERLGLGYGDVRRRRADIVYCSISGYGQQGPYCAVPGHDLNYLGMGGGLPQHAADQGPAAIGMPVVDLATGTTAALAIVAALRRRDRTGDGCFLDVAMLDHAVVWSRTKAPALGGAAPEPAYGVFRARDGRLLSVGVVEDKFWTALCRALGWDDWLRDTALASRHDRMLRADEIFDRLRGRVAERDRDEWLRSMIDEGVPVAPVNDWPEVPGDPQVEARGLLSGGAPRVPLPAELAVPPGPPAALNGACASLLEELGYAPGSGRPE